MTCLAGASSVQQEILEAQPDATLQVYTIWLPMLPTDRRSRWDGHILNDPRVIHLWDADREAGRWLAEHGLGGGLITWDEYLLFGPDGRWEEIPPDPIGGGGPVVGVIGDLEAELALLRRQRGEPDRWDDAGFGVDG